MSRAPSAEAGYVSYLTLDLLHMIHLVNVSGGKDSSCVAAWAKNNLVDFTPVFCDTGWESPITYAYLDYLEQWLGRPIVRLKAQRQFADLVRHEGRFPSRKAQFCTKTLKVRLCIDFILTQQDDVTVYCGKRREESDARRHTPVRDEYLKPDDYKYRVTAVRAWLENYTADVYRPIATWPVEDVFSYAAAYGLLPNPLYKQGFGRVGCFPCVNANHGEVRLIATLYPEIIDKVEALEVETDATFFAPGYIPARFCSKHVQSVNKKTGKLKGTWVPTIRDVVAYVTEHRDQAEMYPISSCQSQYGLCE